MLKTFKYKLEPNFKQRQKLDNNLNLCRELYNLCLEQRKITRISCNNQQKQLVEFKKVFPEFQQVNSAVLIDTIQRLEKTFQSFFRRVKQGKKPGYPRFKSSDRYNSITFWSDCFRLEGKYLKLSKIGNIKLRLSRPLPSGSKIKFCTIKRSCGKWYASLCIEYVPTPLPVSNLSVGVDVGITKFVALSDGSFIENPRYFQNSEKKLRKLNRKFARCKKTSNNRKQVKIILQKFHQHVQNQRKDFLHKLSTDLVRKYDFIAVEDLDIKQLTDNNYLSKQIHDCSWSSFFSMLSYKAESAGRKLVKVNPAYTSQTCPRCGHVSRNNRKTQANFRCESCGYSDNADFVGACNILTKGMQQPAWMMLSSDDDAVKR